MIVYRTAVVMSTALAWSKLLWDKPWGMPVGTACERTAAAPGRPPGRRGVYGVPYLRGVGPALAGRARGRAEGGHHGAVVVAGRGGRRCVRATLSRPGPSRHTRWTLTRQTYSGAGGASPWTWGWCLRWCSRRARGPSGARRTTGSSSRWRGRPWDSGRSPRTRSVRLWPRS